MTSPHEFRDRQMHDATFEHVDLTGATFDRVDLSRTTLRSINFDGADIRNASFADVRLRGVELRKVEIWGELIDVRLNGIDVGALVEAELMRQHPERAQLHPADADGFRGAWEVIDDLWTGTLERARRLEAIAPQALHECVDGEWSFVQTLRHLAFATSSWLSRAIQGDPSPWHPWELPWDEMPPTPGVPHDREARPTLDEALELRRDRFERVRAHLSSLTNEDLAGTREVPAGAGWPPPGEQVPVKEALDTLLNEEWWHRQFAERDLAVLESRHETETSRPTEATGRHTGSTPQRT
ncbi:hypothetical protein N802_04250 [Knoellia sinensis KCTC 19936]|uniref:DinB-like domain-containing protein n=1 Tax=Knoellia sinensis KCTC 19936 TaxID=1385520 RepID=A0A0A0J6S0_9MICO|nr:DinB family protein [Knoellia sinensis]KGN31306.1 hypothetical protein N802_04250 [Knoellia sinensis KCTC 19936]